MRAHRAVWSPFGAHDQRKRPHKLPDHAVKERRKGRPPLSETAHYTHAPPPIKRPSDDAPGLATRPVPWAPRWCAATRARGRSERGRAEVEGQEPATSGLLAGASQGTPDAVSAAWHGLSDATPRPPPRVRSQSAVAMAVRAVRSSFASSGFALDRKSSIYPSANGAACGSLTRSGSRWAPRTRNS